MATLAMIKWFVEGNDFSIQLQADVKEIEGPISNIVQGWDDLNFGILNNPEFADILGSGLSTAKSLVIKTQGDSKTFLQSEIIQVGQPNDNGHGDLINLYYGTASEDDDQDIEQNYQDTQQVWDPDEGEYVTEPAAATVWEVLFTTGGSLMTNCYDCYYDCGAGPGTGLGCDWSMNGQLNLNCTMWDGGADNGTYCAAQGSLAQWAPFIHLSGGDPSALNADAFIG